MKTKLTIILSLAMVLMGCGKINISNEDIIKDIQDNHLVIVIDSCEYIGFNFLHNNSLLTHKGNCKYCKQRNTLKIK